MKDKELDPRLEKKLKTIDRIPARDARAIENGRSQFQLEVDRTIVNSLKAVSKSEDRRPKGWIVTNGKNTIPRKGLTKMAKVFLTIFLAVTTFLTATSVTLVAAQSSMPDQALYPAKIWTEDVRMDLASNDPQTQLNLALEFADRRITEIETMATQDKAAPDSVLDRWQLDISYAYQALLQLQGEDFGPALARVEATLRTQLESMSQNGANSQTQALLTRSRTMIQEHLRLITGSGEEQQQIQTQLQQQVQEQQQINQPEDAGNPGSGASNGEGPNEDMDANFGQPEEGIMGPQGDEDHAQWCLEYMNQMGYDMGAGMGTGSGSDAGTGSEFDSGLGAEYWYMYCQSLLTSTPQPAGGPGNGNGGRP